MTALLARREQTLRSAIGFAIVALLFYVIDGVIVHSAVFLRKAFVSH